MKQFIINGRGHERRLVPWKDRCYSVPKESIANRRGYQQAGPLETLRWFCTWESLLQTGEDLNKDWSSGNTEAILHLGESTANRRGSQQRLVLWKHRSHSAPGRVRNKWESTLPKTGLLERLRPFCTWESLLQTEEDINKDWSSQNTEATLHLEESTNAREYQQRPVTWKDWDPYVPSECLF